MENILEQCFTVKGNTSTIEFLGNGTVRKTINLENSTSKKLNKILANFYPNIRVSPLMFHEILALNTLNRFNIAPKVLKVNKNSFIMTNTGKPVTKSTKFSNLKERVDYILKCLNLVYISHNDLRKSFQNYTCLNGNLYLIDFQLADIKGGINIVPSIIMKKKLKPRSWNDRKDLNWLLEQFNKTKR